jgi:protein-tyrosine phosphatase
MIDVSKITDQLYVGSCMRHEHVEELRVHKFSLIISMIAQEAPHEIFTLPPFKTIWIRTYDHIFIPISIKKLQIGVEAALPVLKEGGKVLVFCMQGRRRSVCMASAILIATGLSSDEAAELLVKNRNVADPRAWYIRRQIKAFEKFWRNKEKVQ